MKIKAILNELKLGENCLEHSSYVRMIKRAIDIYKKDEEIIYKNISWLPKNSMMNIIFEEEREVPVSAVFAFIFSEDREFIYLMENANRDRGLDIPGGHIDPGETSLEALHREVLEEVGLTVKSVSYIGSQKIIKNIVEDKYPHYISAQNFYISTIDEIKTTDLEKDSLEMVKVSVEEYIDYLENKEDCYYKELFFKALKG